MTQPQSSFRLFKVKCIVFIIIFSLLFGLHQRPFANLIAAESSQETFSDSSHDHHDHDQNSALEALQILLTGSVTHSHEHDESEDSNHEHPHEHHYNGALTSAVFILAQIDFSFPVINLEWPTDERPLALYSYYSEILKPPIFS